MKLQYPGRKISLFIFVSILLLFSVSCTENTPPVKVPEINIGIITYEKEGNIERVSTINSANLATEKINSAGGVEIDGVRQQVNLILKGIKGHNPESSVKAVRELINQGNVVAIVGPQSSIDAIPAGEVAEQSRIPLIAPISTNPKTTAGRDYVFRMGFLDEFQGHVAAYFSREELGAETAAVVYNVANPYSRGIAAKFRKHFEEDGGRVVAFESYTTDEADFTRQLEMAKNQDPAVLYLPNYSSETELIVHQARKMGIGSVFMGGDSWDRHEFTKNSEFDGSYMTAHYFEKIRSEENRIFVTRYQEQFDLVPGDTAALTYDAFNLIFAAISRKGKTDPQSIREGLYDLGPYGGVGGSIDFVDNGDPVKGAVVLQIKDGSVNFISIVEPN